VIVIVRPHLPSLPLGSLRDPKAGVGNDSQ
jgi:hypothetical protein